MFNQKVGKMFNQKTNRKNQQKGFTLIELVVVVAVLGVLAAVAAPQFPNLTERAELNAAANSISSSAKTQFASDLVDGNIVGTEWDDDVNSDTVCEELVGGELLSNYSDYEDYKVSKEDGGDVILTSPMLNSDGDVASQKCEIEMR